MTLQQIHDAIPHREPFLMVDEILEWSDARILCAKTFSGQEEFFRGHYPGCPLVPGVLLCEAAMQAGAILLSRRFAQHKDRIPVVTRMTDVRFKQIVRPGHRLRIEVEFKERLADVYWLDAKVTVEDKVCVRFEFACTAAPRLTT